MKKSKKLSIQKIPGPVEGGRSVFLERVLFNNRIFFMVLFTVISIWLGYHALQLRPEASFLRMIPTYHPYIENYITHQDDLKGLGNRVLIAVETTEGDIFNKDYFETLKNIHDEVFFIPGVGRGGLQSLWSPATRWTQVTKDGFEGGPVIPDGYDGSPKTLAALRQNVLRSGEIGTLVAANFKSSIIYVPVQDFNPETGNPLDYNEFSKHLEKIRTQFESKKIKIHITGFAKLMGDLIEGASRVILFFGITFLILLAVLYMTSRCLPSTFARAISSIVAVVWQLGLLQMLGYGLNPYSMLVPFLMFALGVSHGIQMSNAMAHEMIDGVDKIRAARRAFRKLYIPGLAALFTDAVGFATLFVILIGVIQDIAVGATIGVIVVAFTDLMLLPILLSYTGMNKKSLERRRQSMETSPHRAWHFVAKVTNSKPALIMVLITILAFGIGFYEKQDLKIGDLDPGAPELRPNSRYNKDAAFMNKNYAASSDLYVVMLKTPPGGNSNYNALVAVDRLTWKLEGLKGVESVRSIVDTTKKLNAGWSEGYLKWYALPRGADALDNMATKAPAKLSNRNGSLTPLLIYLKDHKAETLTAVTNLVEKFSKENHTENYQFLLAAGSAGIQAATNIEIEKAQLKMTLLVYSVIFLVCLSTYRSLKGAICVLVPLYLTSVLCEALMTYIGIGIKVATLPVIAVGVGVGVDYAIYTYNSLKMNLEKGLPLEQAFFETLNTTGRAVIFTGTTLALGVGSWILSPIKFQADMGLLLTFMFLGNMMGALVLLPAFIRLSGLWKSYTTEESDEIENGQLPVAEVLTSKKRFAIR